MPPGRPSGLNPLCALPFLPHFPLRSLLLLLTLPSSLPPVLSFLPSALGETTAFWSGPTALPSTSGHWRAAEQEMLWPHAVSPVWLQWLLLPTGAAGQLLLCSQQWLECGPHFSRHDKTAADTVCWRHVPNVGSSGVQVGLFPSGTDPS